MLPPLQVIRGEDTLVESRDVNTGFMQTGFQFLKIGLKPVFGFTAFIETSFSSPVKSYIYYIISLSAIF